LRSRLLYLTAQLRLQNNLAPIFVLYLIFDAALTLWPSHSAQLNVAITVCLRGPLPCARLPSAMVFAR
jgi:hypothetical protein